MTFSIELKVPADVAFAGLVEYFVADAMRRAELDAISSEGVVSAAKLGFGVIVEQAMAEARDPIRIAASCSARYVTVSLYERGLPLDDALANRDPNWAHIVESVDEAHWHLHGNTGTELRLRTHRPHAARFEEPQMPLDENEVPLAPIQSYEIRRFRPEDAAGVARAFYHTYGYHYDMPAVYVPARLIELNRLEQYTSIVAVGEDGEIAGHYALAREGSEPIADGCGAVVLPSHRGRNLLNLMRSEAERVAAEIGLAAYYSEPVTDHGRTQHASESFGAKACGITLGDAPSDFVAKHMELSTTTQRQSCMLYIKPLREREKRTIYAPSRHRAIVERIYRELNLPVTFEEGEIREGRGIFHTAINKADAFAEIRIERAQRSTGELIGQALEDLKAMRRLGAIYAYLSLEDSGTPVLCEALESMGFFFSGVGPWMLEGRDALRLQMTLTPIDLSVLTVIGDFGKELLAYIAAERERRASPA